MKLPLDPGVVLLDIGFTDADPNHGAPVGRASPFGIKCIWLAEAMIALSCSCFYEKCFE